MSLEQRLRHRWQEKENRRKTSHVFPSAMRIWDVPTKFGWVILLSLGVMFIWSANHQLNLGYALIFLIFIFWLLGWVVVADQLANLEVSATGGAPVWAGDEASFAVHIREKNGRERGKFTLRNDWHEMNAENLPAGETVSLILPEPTEKRGWHAMSGFTLFSTYPAGAFISWQWLLLQAQVLVYPRPIGDLPLPWKTTAGTGKAVGGMAGEDELSTLRPYASGDPLSRVAWKRYGRGELLLKQFTGEGVPQVILDFAAIPMGNIETKLSQLAKWIVEAEEAGVSYALQLPNLYLDFSRGQIHKERCLEALALF